MSSAPTLAVTFLGLAMTGLTLRFSSAAWAADMARVVGGFGTVLFFHLISAVVLTVAFLIHVANLVTSPYSFLKMIRWNSRVSRLLHARRPAKREAKEYRPW